MDGNVLDTARRELDQVIDEIRTIDGYEDFLAAPSFDDIARAANPLPLVYIAAADLGGLALVVRGDQVEDLVLDGLTAAAVHDRVQGYLSAYTDLREGARDAAALARWRTVIDEVTAWLWDDVMGPVLMVLRQAPAAAFIAGGLLGLLPLHAAWTTDAGTPTGRRYALDELTMTFTPNARALAAARLRAAGSATRLLAVADPTANLASTAGEVQVAAAAFDDSTVLAADATPERVCEVLRTVDVAHFACHGYAMLDTPLDSGLDLAGGRSLTLRDILALELRMRLVALSACESSLPGAYLPDEVVALPTGLLQAGVGGVLASLWRVGDVPTLILMTEFYRRWRWHDEAPPDALRGAQRWLRDATNGEIVTAYRTALAQGAAWLPDEAALTVLSDLMPQEPAKRRYGGADSWAAFHYIGA